MCLNMFKREQVRGELWSGKGSEGRSQWTVIPPEEESLDQLPTAANPTAGYLGRQPVCLPVGKRGHVQLFIHSEIGSDTIFSLLLLCQSEDHSLVNKYLLGTMTSSGLCCILWGTGCVRSPCIQGASRFFFPK